MCLSSAEAENCKAQRSSQQSLLSVTGQAACSHRTLLCGKKFFELDAQFVRLKGEQAVWGSSSILYLAKNCTVGSRRTGLEGRFTFMRSDLVFGALSHVSNRYQLCQLASKATRKLHKPTTRLQDTTNEVLVRFHSSNPGSLAQVTAPAARPIETRRAA